MARKRLSDLLREEASKPEDSDAAAATPARRRSTSRAATKTTDRRTAEPVAETTPEAPASTDREPGTEPDREPDTEPDASATLIHELKATLEQSQQREATLQQQIADLNAEVEAQQAIVKTLAQERDRAASLKQELEQVKADALRLAQANTKLTADLEALRTAAKPAAPAPKAEIQPAPQKSERAETKPAQTPRTQTETLQQRQARSLAHPVFPKPPVSQSTDPDLGWMD